MSLVKRYYIKTFGCQANMADSGMMAGILEALGWEQFVPKGEDNESHQLEEVLRSVDLLIINTCSVRQKSEDKVYGIGKQVKKVVADTGKKPLIILAGCLVGSATGERKRFELDVLKKKMPWVDKYISPKEINTLSDILSLTDKVNLQQINPVVKEGEFAYVNISTGCDNFCSYCVVPYARDREISRSQQEIISEIKSLIKRGHSKIMLCGQNVNSWGLNMKEKMQLRAGESRNTPFVRLLKEVHDLEGLAELTFISSNPFDFTQELIDSLKLPKMSKYLHIAVQSGSDEILKKMNRRHTVAEFIKLVEEIRKAVPEIELGTDAIVGFPGETRAQFMATVKLFERLKFKVAFISMYSPRAGTWAQKQFSDDVDQMEKKWRHAHLTKVWRESLKAHE